MPRFHSDQVYGLKYLRSDGEQDRDELSNYRTKIGEQETNIDISVYWFGFTCIIAFVFESFDLLCAKSAS